MYGAIILTGIKHCGKSTQGRLLSERLKCPFYDTDDVVREMTGSSPREIYTRDGEDAFKSAEALACRKIVAELEGKGGVVATGGGICSNPGAVEVLKKAGTFVFLKSPESVAAERIVREISVADDGSLSNMPAYIARKNPGTLDDVRMIFHEFFMERCGVYSGLADVIVDMGTGTKTENMEKILAALQ